MPVNVLTRQRLRFVSAAGLRRQAGRLLDLLGERRAELTISLVTDEEIRRLNAEFRGKNAPTDVLAFAMREGKRIAGDEQLLGDVVISLDSAGREARDRHVPIAEELMILLIHGVLHLLGYDHERSTAEARRMRRRERELKAVLGAAGSGAQRRLPVSRRSGV